MKRILFLLFPFFLSTQILAEPVERQGLILSYGVGDVPGFIEKLPDDPKIEGYLRYRGNDLSLSYIYYGKGGYKGVFSGKYSIDWVRVASYPYEKKSKVFIEKEKIIITETIFFGSGKANILPVSFSILDVVAKLLLQNPDIKIRIEGHTDSVGNDEANMRLSQARAESVMKYLIRKGVSPARMEARGYGETMPVADNSTPEGRAKNRRVEFVIVGQ